jgi:hypothetical protein
MRGLAKILAFLAPAPALAAPISGLNLPGGKFFPGAEAKS